MSVRSEPLTSTSARTKQSAIVSRATLDRQRGSFERMMAIILLFVSFAGSVAAFSGGWAALLAAPSVGVILAGIAVQVALTASQWWYGSGRGPWRYRLALLFDTALTAVGFGPLVVPPLATYLLARGVGDLASALAWCIIIIASALLAWFPEKTLID
jgi:MFS family permease